MLPLAYPPLPASPNAFITLRHTIAVDESIHFVGPWTRVEKEAVCQAVARLETPSDELNVLLGKPWVCTCEVIGNRRLFAASRLAGGPRVFSAYTADVLASQIAALESESV